MTTIFLIVMVTSLLISLGDILSSATAQQNVSAVNMADTTITVTSDANPSILGQSVTFTAAVASGAGTPTGTVTFYDSTTIIGTGTLDDTGQARFTASSLSGGSHTITASYGGDGNFNPSTSSTLTQTVNMADTTITVTSDANPSILGQSVTFTAAVASGAGTPTGTVTFSIDSVAQSAVSLSGGRAILSTTSLSFGSYTISAKYSGDTNFITSRSSVLTQTVNRASFDIAIYKHGSNNVVKKLSSILYNGTDAVQAVRTAINNLPNGGEILIYNGTYYLNKQINFVQNIHLRGQGNSTILDYSGIGTLQAIVMAKGSLISDVKISGSIYRLPTEFTQKIVTADNSVIQNIVISNMGSGIETVKSKNVTLSNIRCENVRDRQDYADCIHAGVGTQYLNINGFTMKDSDRGIEIGAGAKNVTAKNGYLENIRNFNNTGHEAFSIDVHSHDGEGGDDNVSYMNILLKNCNSPDTKVAGSLYNISDLPRNVLFQNVTVVNPRNSWQANGDGLTIKDSKVINPIYTTVTMYKNSRNIVIDGFQTDALHSGQWFVANGIQHTGIQNVKVVNSKITISPDKLTGAVMSFIAIDDLTLKNNVEIKNLIPYSSITYVN